MSRARVGALVALVLVAVGLLVAHALGTYEAPKADEGAGPGPGRFAASSDRQRAVVYAVGDGADGGDNGQRVAAMIAAERPDRVLYLGDVYPSGTTTDFRDRYAPTYGRFARITAPTPGNHDWPNHVVGYDTYWRGVSGRRPPSYYAFSLAGWRILSLNSEDEHGPGSEQIRWLRDQVRGPGTCRLAFWHRPRFSAGAMHGDQPDVQPFWDALEGHAPLVLNGHEHDMQQIERGQGITELVAGGGGADLYAVDTAYRGLVFGDDDDYGALRLELRPGAARFRFVSADGRTLRSGSVGCRPR